MACQIHIDSDSCTASGICMRALPSVFGLGDDSAIVLNEDGADDDEIVAAAYMCPWSAITVYDRDTGECLCP